MRRWSRFVNRVCQPGEATILSVGKFDFTNFFMEVNRECVQQALTYWIRKVTVISGRRKTLRVKKTQAWKMNRHQTGRWEVRGARLVARGDVSADEVVFTTRALNVVLAADLSNLLRSTGQIWRQQRGLTIGSCWGGTGCRVWSAYREEQATPMLLWARRRDFELWDLMHGCQQPPPDRLEWGKIRWVDDRWVVMKGLTVQGVYCARVIEFLSYANAGPWATLAIAKGVTALVREHEPWPSLKVLLDVSQIIFDFVRMDHMRQTVETPEAVVGFDVMIVHGTQLIVPSELVRCDRQASIGLALRMTTKDERLFADRAAGGLVNPRLIDRRVDCRSKVRRVDGLVQWAVRLADCHRVLFATNTWPAPVSVWSQPGSELQQWLVEPWIWFALELSRAGWQENEWDKALFRAWVCAAGGSSGNPARAHRRKVLEGAYRLAYYWQRVRNGCTGTGRVVSP